MKRFLSLFFVLGLIIEVLPCNLIYAEYEDTEMFLTEITYLKQAAYDRLKQNFTTIDLSQYVTAGYVDEVSGDNKGGWTDEGAKNDLREFDLKGINFFKGIPFDLVDPDKNDGKACIVMAGRGATFVPDSVDVPINKKTAGLYFLQCHAWNYGDGDKKGQYTLVYDDGTSATVDLIENENIHNFWGAADYATFQNVWKANHPTGGQENAIGLFALSNPYPEKTIEKIHMHSMDGGTKSWLMVFAITLTDSGPYLPDIGIIDVNNPSTSSWLQSDGNFDVLSGSALDASNLLEKPAGKHGTLKTNEDDFVFEDGSRIKFWGINLPFNKDAYDKDNIDKIAKDISQMGYNLVRIKLNPYEITDDDIDSIHYLCSRLKENGIYTYLALNNNFDLNKFFKREFIEKQKNGIRKLIGSENKYTGISLAKDLSVVMMEFMPESGLYYYTPKVNSDVDAKELQKQFNAYLKNRYRTSDKLRDAWRGDDKVGLNDYENLENGTVILDKNWKSNTLYSYNRNLDVRKFFDYIQTSYYNEMKNLVDTLGYKGLSTCNSNPLGEGELGDAYLNSKTDFMAHGAINAYNSRGDDITQPIFFNKSITSALESNGLGVIGELSAFKYNNKPYIVSSWNSGWVNKNHAEDYVAMAVYGAKQNWNPIAYSYMTTGLSEKDKLTGFYDIYNNAVSRVSQVGAVRLFNAVNEMKNTRITTVKEDDIYMADYSPHYMHLKDNKVLTFINKDKFQNFYKFKTLFTVGNSTDEIKTPSRAVYNDDDIKCDTLNGELFVITDKAEAYSGQNAMNKSINLKTLSLNMKNNYYTSILTSVDNNNLSESDRMLLSVTASIRNKGYSLTENYLNSSGRTPIIIQPIEGSVVVKDKDDFTVYSLDTNGNRSEEVNTYKNENGFTAFNINEYSYMNETRSLCFEMVRK